MTARLGKLLEEITGLSPRVLGDKNLTRAIKERMSACKLADEELYIDKARSSSREMEALIEAVVVSETSFFRDKGPFILLRQFVRDEWMPVRHARILRILSAPCSSGEEPYSIAIVLQEAGLNPDEYNIDALDISRALLGKAERSAYTQHSFRGVATSIRDRYFVSAGREYVLKDSVRRGVHFIHGNLLDEHILAGKRPYDIVFCRNLLIYFGAESRTRVTKSMERLVARNGLLFVGHAETRCFSATVFSPLEYRGAFGFRKTESSISAPAAALEGGVPPRAMSPLPSHLKARVPQEIKPPSDQAIAILKTKDSLEAARQLADQGRLPEAAGMCERLLLSHKANAAAHCLLGTVLQGMGNIRRAEECFNRAIYLDERCYDAVVYLSLIKEHKGDLAGAEVLRRRAARIQPQMRAL